MNITESNAVSLLLRTLNGDQDVDCFDVATAAVMLKARVHATLQASPRVIEGLVVASDVTRCISLKHQNQLLVIGLSTSMEECMASIQARRDARTTRAPPRVRCRSSEMSR